MKEMQYFEYPGLQIIRLVLKIFFNRHSISLGKSRYEIGGDAKFPF